MRILRDDEEGVAWDTDGGVEIDLAGGDDEGGREEDEDDVEDHDLGGANAEVDVGAEDGDVHIHFSGDAVTVFMTLLRTSAALHVRLCQENLVAPDASAVHRAYMWSNWCTNCGAYWW